MSNFDEFWSRYPGKKVSKPKCQEKYNKLSDAEHKEIMLAIDAQCRYRAELKKSGTWMENWCNTQTFINQSRQYDEIPSIAEHREKIVGDMCCINGCDKEVMGKRFATCIDHFSHDSKGRIRGNLSLVDELRKAYDPTIAGRPKTGVQALRWALERIK